MAANLGVSPHLVGLGSCPPPAVGLRFIVATRRGERQCLGAVHDRSDSLECIAHLLAGRFVCLACARREGGRDAREQQQAAHRLFTRWRSFVSTSTSATVLLPSRSSAFSAFLSVWPGILP